MSDLVCPKCHGSMRSYERSGVLVDQCTECRGLFLDRGELERLVDAENAWATQAPPAAMPQATVPPQDHQQAVYSTGPGYGTPPAYGKPYKKRKSFLEELFD